MTVTDWWAFADGDLEILRSSREQRKCFDQIRFFPMRLAMKTFVRAEWTVSFIPSIFYSTRGMRSIFISNALIQNMSIVTGMPQRVLGYR